MKNSFLSQKQNLLKEKKKEEKTFKSGGDGGRGWGIMEEWVYWVPSFTGKVFLPGQGLCYKTPSLLFGGKEQGGWMKSLISSAFWEWMSDGEKKICLCISPSLWGWEAWDRRLRVKLYFFSLFGKHLNESVMNSMGYLLGMTVCSLPSPSFTYILYFRRVENDFTRWEALPL